MNGRELQEEIASAKKFVDECTGWQKEKIRRMQARCEEREEFWRRMRPQPPPAADEPAKR